MQQFTEKGHIPREALTIESCLKKKQNVQMELTNNTETELAILKLPTRNRQGPDVSTDGFFQTFRINVMPA